MSLHVSVAENDLGPQGAKILAEMLSVSSSVTSLNLAKNELVPSYGPNKGDMTGIKAIADALGVSTCSLNSLK